MNHRSAFSLAIPSLLLGGLIFLSNNALGQQPGPASHKYFFRAALTVEGIRDLQNRSATALRAGVAKLNESVGCKLESWYFDYGENTTYGFVDCPDEIAAATLAAGGNAGGFAHVTYRSVLSPEDADKALAKSKATRPAQQQ